MQTLKGILEFPDLVGPWYDHRLSQYKKSPCNSNRASSLGSDCERELAYWRTAWEDAADVPDSSKIVMQEGQKHEDAILMELQKAGLTVIEQQVTIGWPQYKITGHLDAVVVHNGESIPVDIKSMAPWIWDGIFSKGHGCYSWEEVAEGFENRSWLRKYRAQLSIYMLGKNVDRGMLLCVNKSTGAMAQVNIVLDYDFAEGLIKRAERINTHVDNGTLPDRIPYEHSTCPRCPFYAKCLPDHEGEDPIKFIRDEVMEEMISERNKAQPGKGFAKLDKLVKTWAKTQDENNFVVGDRYIIRKKRHGKGIKVTIAEMEGRTDVQSLEEVVDESRV